MSRANRHFVWSVFIVLVLILNLLNVQVALADDSTPPAAATEEPGQPPLEPPAAEPTVSVEPVISAPDQPSVEGEAIVSDLLAAVLDNTDIVVVDENGILLPLATQDAAAIVEEADPMWCPEGVLPNGPGCTTNLTVSQLLALMQTNAGGQFNANGVIYFERSGLTTYNTAFVLDDSAASLGSSYSTISTYNMTLRGGWNGGGFSTFSTTQSSVFDNNNNAVVRVGSSGNPWIGDVTLQDILIQDNDGSPGPGNGPGLSVYTTTGDVTLNDVDIDNQGGGEYTAYLNSNSGDITVTNDSTFDGTGDNQGFYAATNTGSITITGTNSNRIIFTDAQGPGNGSNENGATLSAPTVSLSYVTSDGNDGNGISISNVNQVTLNNVIATNNGTNIGGGSGGGGYSNDIGSGVYISGNAGSFVSVLDGTYTGNERYGIEVTGTSVFIGSSIDSCQTTSISGGCLNVTAITDTSAPVIAFVSRTPAANGNGWNNTDVTVTWSCSDAQSGVVSATVTQIVSTEGSNQSVTGTCTNKAGRTASNTQTGINIDKTAPGITFSNKSPAANGSGWNTSNVTVNWSCTDATSGVVSAAISQTVTTEGTNQSSTGTCTDLAGNIVSNIQTGINIDKTAPTANASPSPAANGNGWNNTNVTVTLLGSDGGSGIAFCSAPVLLSTEGAGQSASGTCTDLAGNVSSSASASGINIDKTAPTASASAAPSPNGNGWNNSSITVTFTGSDALSGLGSCTSPTVLNTEGAGQSASGSCTDIAGNTSPNATASGINIDLTKPVLNLPANITVQATSGAGAAVNFTASANDSLDPTPSFSCSSASGATFPIGTSTVNCSSTDQAGNTNAGSFDILVQDTTAPTLFLPSNITAEAASASGVVILYAASATDVVDGPIAVICLPSSGSTFAFGTTPVNCSATDSNSNTSTGSFNVTVQDTTPPVIAPMPDISVSTGNAAGTAVTFTPPATIDLVNGAGIAACSPISGSVFPVGSTIVTCSATDAAGNSASIPFTVQVDLKSKSTARPSSSFGGSFIVVTGGEQINLGCLTELYAFGVKLTFLNLCGHQTMIDNMDLGSLPGSLPKGYTFVKGLDVRVLESGKALANLPDNTGIQFDFPSPGTPGTARYALLFWDGSQWIEISDSISENEVNNILSQAVGDELFRIGTTSNGHSKGLTTDPTGIFILVTK